ncbi:MAG: hypothetical protein ACYDHD_10305, partial [Vulcanimicrobiaceae bacterium]
GRFKEVVSLNAERLAKYNVGRFVVSFVDKANHVFINIALQGAPPKMPPTTIDGCGEFFKSYRVNKATLHVTKGGGVCI